MTAANQQQRPVFFVSDRTGLTAESYGKSLLAQFPDHQFFNRTLSFVDTETQAMVAAGIIENAAKRSGLQAIVFSTLVEPETQKIIEQTSACVISLFSVFIAPLEECVGEQSAHTQGIPYHAFQDKSYQVRLDAIDYTLAHDDGIRVDQHDAADVILVGASRCGKTPVSLYLAITFSVKAANYPVTGEELLREKLPEILLPRKSRLVGLTIDPRQLSKIREQRRPGSEYAALAVCQREVRAVESMFADAGIPIFDTTETSIEEISGHIIKLLDLGL